MRGIDIHTFTFLGLQGVFVSGALGKVARDFVLVSILGGIPQCPTVQTGSMLIIAIRNILSGIIVRLVSRLAVQKITQLVISLQLCIAIDALAHLFQYNANEFVYISVNRRPFWVFFIGQLFLQ
jgi:hypothetical protein